MNVFPNGIQGLADSKWAGPNGAAHRLVGIDYRSQPGAIKAQQKLTQISPTEGDNIVDELCLVSLPLSDGSTLWFSSESGKIWREVADTFTLVSTLQIPGYLVNLATAFDIGKSLNVSTHINIPTATVFKPDGLIMYVMGSAKVSGNNGEIFQYTLTEAFDLSTATYASKNKVADVDARGMALSADGTKMFISEDGGSNSVITYTLGTAWDISTAGAAGASFDFSLQGTRGYGLNFSEDGTKMAIFDITSGNVMNVYNLGTAWDVTTAVFDDSVAIAASSGATFSPDGLRILAVKSTNSGTVIEYKLATAWDVSTAVLTTTELNVGGGRYFGLAIAPDSSGFYVGTQDNPETLHQYELTPADEDLNVTVLGAEEYAIPDGPDGADEDTLDDEMAQYVYFATANWLFRIALSDITDWTKYEYLTLFKHGDLEYHPVRKANGRLYFGDKYTILEVNEAGVITLESDFSVREPERITILENFDVDLLIGTKNINGYSRILRWDTESPTWYGEDFIYEDEIHAFLDEDNYTYAIVGDFGQMHYYDGEKLLKNKRVPGEYTKTARCKVHANSVGYFMGIPIFGLSNIEGNPTLQGVYAYGQYSKDYNITLDLAFPVSSGEFADLEIGAIIVKGFDIYVAWKSATSSGIDKLNWSVKYNGAYIETMVLNAPKDRSKFKSVKEILTDYIEMPEGTSLTMQYSKNYEEYITQAQQLNNMLLQLRGTGTIPEVGSVQSKFIFNTTANLSPVVENFHVNFVGEE